MKHQPLMGEVKPGDIRAWGAPPEGSVQSQSPSPACCWELSPQPELLGKSQIYCALSLFWELTKSTTYSHGDTNVTKTWCLGIQEYWKTIKSSSKPDSWNQLSLYKNRHPFLPQWPGDTDRENCSPKVSGGIDGHICWVENEKQRTEFNDFNTPKSRWTAYTDLLECWPQAHDGLPSRHAFPCSLISSLLLTSALLFCLQLL